MSREEDAVDLVRSAISEPLMIDSGADPQFPRALVAWVNEIVEGYPLWALCPHAFAALNDDDLPSTRPLPALVASVSRDERLAELVDPGVGVSLESVIDSRRCSLVLDDRPSWLTPYAHSKKPDGVIQLFGPFGGIRFPTVVEGPVLAYYEPESDYNIGGYVSPYYGGDAQEWAIRLGPFLESCGLAGGFSRLQITVGGQPPWLQDRRVVTQDGISTNGELRSGAA